jgi:hypothetical protein
VLSTEGHFISTVELRVVDWVIEGVGSGCYTLGYVLSSSAENCQILFHSFFRRLWVWNMHSSLLCWSSCILLFYSMSTLKTTTKTW